MDLVDIDLPDTSPADAAGREPGAGLRRRLLGAGIVGIAGSLLPSLVSRAAAASPDEAATTTTAPPQRPTNDDVALLQFAQSVELAVVELYDLALESDGVGDDLRALLTEVRATHLAYGQSLSAMLGVDAAGAASADVVDELADSFGSGDDPDTATAAYELENIAVATHTEFAGLLVGIDGASLIASILIAEARHSLVFGVLAGASDLDALLLTDAKALAPEKA